MKTLLLVSIIYLFSISYTQAQILTPVKWSYLMKKNTSNEAIIYLKATIDDGWHIYSQNMKSGGPTRTSFRFKPSKMYSLTGKTIEPTPIDKYEDAFKMRVGYFVKSVTFQQKVKFNKGLKKIEGTLEYGVCNENQCLPPEEVQFSIPVK